MISRTWISVLSGSVFLAGLLLVLGPSAAGAQPTAAPQNVAQKPEGQSPVSGTKASSMGTSSTSTVADQLVAEALQNNLSVRQKRIGLKQSQAALAQTRGQYLPSVTLKARYSRARGGRTINFPAGDLVNPAYRALEGMTRGREFPTVQNREIQLLRPREQKTTLQVRQPVFQPEIYFGVQARKHKVRSREASLAARRRALARDVRVAYYRYRKAQARVEILKASRSLAEEHRRTNERLLAASKGTRDAVRRAEAEVLAVRQKLNRARSSVSKARRRLNVLRNRKPGTPIPQPKTDVERLIERRTETVERYLGRSLFGPQSGALTASRSVAGRQGASTRDRAPSGRGQSADPELGSLVRQQPRLDRLDAAIKAAEDRRRASQTAFLPTLSLGVDVGIQGTTYGVSGDKPFARASVVLEWTLFDGLRDRRDVQRRRLEAQRLQARRAHVAQRLGLKAKTALDEARVAKQALHTAAARVEASEERFRLASRRYETGRASQTTLIDARTALTKAKLNRTVTRYDVLIHLAKLEHAAGIGAMGARSSR